MGIGYIKPSEYEAWARIHNIQISPSEFQALQAIDGEVVKHQNEQSSSKSGKENATPDQARAFLRGAGK